MDIEKKEKLYSQTYFLTPAECNPQGRMPITLLINRVIEVATLHANHLGIGYADLQPYGQTWVLSRVAVEMARYPGVNDHYTVRTWVSSINRLFSERDFEILDGEGQIIGHSRTLWAVLDVERRTAGDISRLAWVSSLIPSDKTSPVSKPSKPQAVTQPERVVDYRFTYCDLDFNRHVNSSRYIELLLNQWSLDYHDHNRLTRFEIAYIKEAYYDQEVQVRLSQTPTADMVGEPVRAELLDPNSAQPLCRALLQFSPR